MPHIPISLGMTVQIDECDLHLVTGRRWSAKPNSKSKRRYYAHARLGGRYVYLHRVIMDAQPGDVVDHINGDSLDNRRCNLRIVDHRINTINRGPIANRTGLQGVHKHRKLWHGRVTQGREIIARSSGCDSVVKAAFDYDRLAYKIHGPETRLNFPCVNHAALIGEAA